MNTEDLKKALLEAKNNYRKQEKQLNLLQKIDSDINYILFLKDNEGDYLLSYAIGASSLSLLIFAIQIFFMQLPVFIMFAFIPVCFLIFKEEMDISINKYLFKKNKGYKCNSKLFELSRKCLLTEQLINKQSENNIRERMSSIKRELNDILSKISINDISAEQFYKEINCIVIDSDEKFISSAEPIINEDLNKGKQKSKR